MIQIDNSSSVAISKIQKNRLLTIVSTIDDNSFHLFILNFYYFGQKWAFSPIFEKFQNVIQKNNINKTH